MTGTYGYAGDIKSNGGAGVNLTAPTSGDYQGVVLYRDRRADVIDVKFNGGAGFDFTGAIYMPTTNLEMLGNFEFNSQCLQLVGRILTFNGTAEIENNCPPRSEEHTSELQSLMRISYAVFCVKKKKKNH